MSEYSYIDSHVHYAHKRFDDIRDHLLPKLHESGLEAAIEAAISIESNKQMQETLKEYSWIYYSAGLHPTCVSPNATTDELWEREIYEALEHPKVVAVGEAGLDYHRLSWQTAEDVALSQCLIERQKLWFHKQIRIAKDKKLPMIIHTRGVHEDTLEILRQYNWGINSGVIHCFRGNLEQAKAYIELGFVLGIGGAVSYDYKEDVETREALKNIPLENIILETDSPFLTPVGCADKKNHSGNIPMIAEIIARQKDVSIAEVMDRTKERTKEVFGMTFYTLLSGKHRK